MLLVWFYEFEYRSLPPAHPVSAEVIAAVVVLGPSRRTSVCKDLGSSVSKGVVFRGIVIASLHS